MKKLLAVFLLCSVVAFLPGCAPSESEPQNVATYWPGEDTKVTAPAELPTSVPAPIPMPTN